MRVPEQLRTPPSEVALAAVVTAVMAADLGQAAHPFLVGLPLVLVAGSLLAWRLVLPEVPLAAICTANVLLMTTAPGEFGPQTLAIGVMVAVYSAAAHLAGRRAQVAAALSLVLIWVAHAGSREGDVADFLPLLVWGAPWLVGRMVRRQALQARADGARAALLLAGQEAQTREAAQQERDRIARELHDVVAHAVSLMVVQAGAERLANPATPSREALVAIEDAGRRALVELRTMLGVLRTSGEEERDPQPDLEALPELVERVRAAGLPVELQVRGEAEVPAGVALSAYRVVQEALTNALRHAGEVPTCVTVVLTDEVVVEVRSGLPPAGRPAAAGSGRGITGMRERVALHGGVLDAGPESSAWVVRARMPLARGGVT
ncbi:MAG TPA: histidine kinase [Mycobacteriales bacterium]|nr:histidine kinase [Mycobacteriales bacterium]